MSKSTNDLKLIYFYSIELREGGPQNDEPNMNFSFKNVTEKLPLLGLSGLYFLPVGSSEYKVGEGELGPNVPRKLIRSQLAFTRNWKGRIDGRGSREEGIEPAGVCDNV